MDIGTICAGSVHLAYEDGRFVWQDEVLRQFPLVARHAAGRGRR